MQLPQLRAPATAWLEGFTHLVPYAAGHEIIRQQRRDLTLIRMTPDIIAASTRLETRG